MNAKEIANILSGDPKVQAYWRKIKAKAERSRMTHEEWERAQPIILSMALIISGPARVELARQVWDEFRAEGLIQSDTRQETLALMKVSEAELPGDLVGVCGL